MLSAQPQALAPEDNEDIFCQAALIQARWLCKLAKSTKLPVLAVVESSFAAKALARDLRFFARDLKVQFFDNLDVLPYDDALADPKTIAQRLAALAALLNQTSDLVIAPVAALMDKTIPQDQLPAAFLNLAAGKSIGRQALRDKLLILGYQAVSQVEERGEFSLRGEKLDIFCGSFDHPLRIIFSDDLIEQARFFDLDSQRSIAEKPPAVITIPATSEVLLSAQNLARAKRKFSAEQRKLLTTTADKLSWQMESGHSFGKQRWLLPLYYETSALLIDYLPKTMLR